MDYVQTYSTGSGRKLTDTEHPNFTGDGIFEYIYIFKYLSIYIYIYYIYIYLHIKNIKGGTKENEVCQRQSEGD